MAKSTTPSQDREFVKRLMDGVSRGRALEYIADVLAGDASWVVEWVENNFAPEDVFSEDALARWATDNGYVKSE